MAAFQNGSPITFSGSADVSASTSSTGYSDASGQRNILFNANINNDLPNGEHLIIGGIDTSGHTNLELSFGHSNDSPTSYLAMALEYRAGTTGSWTAIPYTRAPEIGWAQVTTDIGILPSIPNLQIRFRQKTPQTSPTVKGSTFLIDDVVIKGTTFVLPPAVITATGTLSSSRWVV